jgi:hypothetical protein
MFFVSETFNRNALRLNSSIPQCPCDFTSYRQNVIIDEDKFVRKRMKYE